MLHHGSQCNGHHHGNGGGDQRSIRIAHQRKHRIAHLERQTDPGSVLQCLHLVRIQLTEDSRCRIGDHHTQQDGDNLDHALAPDVADNHHRYSQNGDPPVARAVVNGTIGQGNADADNDGTRDNGREEAHHLLGTESLKEDGQNYIQQTCACHADACVGNPVSARAAVFHQFPHGEVSPKERKGRAQECRHLPLGQQMKQQGAQTCKQQRCADAQACQGRHQHRGAKHGEHVLKTEECHFPGGKLLIVH